MEPRNEQAPDQHDHDSRPPKKGSSYLDIDFSKFDVGDTESGLPELYQLEQAEPEWKIIPDPDYDHQEAECLINGGVEHIGNSPSD